MKILKFIASAAFVSGQFSMSNLELAYRGGSISDYLGATTYKYGFPSDLNQALRDLTDQDVIDIIGSVSTLHSIHEISYYCSYQV